MGKYTVMAYGCGHSFGELMLCKNYKKASGAIKGWMEAEKTYPMNAFVPVKMSQHLSLRHTSMQRKIFWKKTFQK